MGILDTDYIKDMFGSVFSDIYASGQLIRVTQDRLPGGGFKLVEATPVPIKVQKDRCTESMRQAQGYTSDNVKLLILQSGVPGGKPTTDDIVVVDGERWKIYEIYEDPAQTYWAGRGVRQK